MALAQSALGTHGPPGLSARRRRLGAVFRRRHHHAGDFGAFGARGPQAGRRRPRAVRAAGDGRHPGAAVPRPEPRHGAASRRSSGRSWWCSSSSTPCSALMHIPRRLGDPARAQPVAGVAFLWSARRDRLHRARQRVPGRDRRRGALRRHGPFRPPADPGGLAVRRAAGADLQLSRPGRADPRRSQGGRKSVLSAGAGLGAAAADPAVDRGDGDRQPGGHHRRLFAGRGRRSSSACCRVSRSSTPRTRRKARSSSRASIACCCSACWRWCCCSAPPTRSPTPMASRSPARW